MKTLKSINKLAYLVTTLCTSLIFAQEEASWLKGFKLSGSADVFYKYDFAKSDLNTKTSFTQPTNSLEIGMFTLKLNHHLGLRSMQKRIELLQDEFEIISFLYSSLILLEAF